MTKPISQDVFVVVNPYKNDNGYWIKGVYSTIEAAACAAQEEMDCLHPEDKDNVVVSRHRLIDTIEAKTSLIKHLDWMKERSTESIEREEKAIKEEAQEILDEESTKSKEESIIVALPKGTNLTKRPMMYQEEESTKSEAGTTEGKFIYEGIHSDELPKSDGTPSSYEEGDLTA
tara:strand:+ start:520 stop:1041 length:522 start_codon:yes stop_codon:yes gene_type:complete